MNRVGGLVAGVTDPCTGSSRGGGGAFEWRRPLAQGRKHHGFFERGGAFADMVSGVRSAVTAWSGRTPLPRAATC